MRKYLKSFLTVFGLSLMFLVLFASTSLAAENEKTYNINKKDAVYDKSLGKYVTPLKKVDGTLVPLSTEGISCVQKKRGYIA